MKPDYITRCMKQMKELQNSLEQDTEVSFYKQGIKVKSELYGEHCCSSLDAVIAVLQMLKEMENG